MESETIHISMELKQYLHEISLQLAQKESQLLEQRRQRPYNIPFIRKIEEEIKNLDLNYKHIKDRLDKVDGCF